MGTVSVALNGGVIEAKFVGVTFTGSCNPINYPPGYGSGHWGVEADGSDIQAACQGAGYVDPDSRYESGSPFDVWNVGTPLYGNVSLSNPWRFGTFSGTDVLSDYFGWKELDFQVENGFLTKFNTVNGLDGYTDFSSQQPYNQNNVDTIFGTSAPETHTQNTPQITMGTDGVFRPSGGLVDGIFQTYLVNGVQAARVYIGNGGYANCFWAQANYPLQTLFSERSGIFPLRFKILKGLVEYADIGGNRYGTAGSGTGLTLTHANNEAVLRSKGCNTNGDVDLPLIYGCVFENRYSHIAPFADPNVKGWMARAHSHNFFYRILRINIENGVFQKFQFVDPINTIEYREASGTIHSESRASCKSMSVIHGTGGIPIWDTLGTMNVNTDFSKKGSVDMYVPSWV